MATNPHNKLQNLRIALVHDHLLEFGGAERVFVELVEQFPRATIFTSAYDVEVVKKRIPRFSTWDVRTSWAMRIPFFRKLYSPLRFLAPFIWKSFDFSQFDVVISSTGWFMCKGIDTKSSSPDHVGPIHISYIHHPPSYLYGYETAMDWKKYWPIRLYAGVVNHFLRMYDFEASQKPDVLIANSQETRRRIQKFYRRDALVVYPPVYNPSRLPVRNHAEIQKNGHYITVSRLALKKHVEVMVEAANKFGFPLVVIGSGREEERLRAMAGPTVSIKGYVPDEEYDELFAQAKAFINCAVDEDFGIAPVEALGRGVPVIAYASGGLKETIQHRKNGMLFDSLTTGDLIQAIEKFESMSEAEYRTMCEEARTSAKKYSEDEFEKNMRKVVLDALTA